MPNPPPAPSPFLPSGTFSITFNYTALLLLPLADAVTISMVRLSQGGGVGLNHFFLCVR